jgi:GNAT superfamily N-acetyltransferase
MSEMKLTIAATMAEQDIFFLRDRLVEFNRARTSIKDDQYLSVFIRNEAEQIIGGLFGYTWGGHCEVIYLWVDESLRGKGIGKSILIAAEEEAIRRGCHHMVLNTHSFQAPEFYQKLGFEVFGTVDDAPRGFQNIYLKKRLVR